MSVPVFQKVKTAYAAGGIEKVFIEVLGWDAVQNQREQVSVEQITYVGEKVSTLLGGIAVLQFKIDPNTSAHQQKQLARALGVRYPECLLILNSDKFTIWMWPKKTSSGATAYERLEVKPNSLPTFLAQRLAGLQITANDLRAGLTLEQVREKLRGSFDTGKVTKTFFDQFRKEHLKLAAAITGLEPESAHSYSTLLMNRLMFLYFLQKKEFLNQDANYLFNCLRKLQGLNGRGNFYNFYQDLLLVLFFEGLNKKNGQFKTPEIRQILGEVPYINGGVFGESEIEQNNQISIPDEAFAELFKFFDSYTWHLDTRPTGNQDEINPEVIGYIFEQYINFTANDKRENGAYYTKHDVTGYMVSQTLVPRLLDDLVELDLRPLELVIGSGHRYINPSMLHGWVSEKTAWLAVDPELQKVWAGDPIGWTYLDDAETDPEVCLLGESWVEMFHRRDRVTELLKLINAGEVKSVNDLITHNLNAQLLLTDCIDGIQDPNHFDALWKRLVKLSVIDPTCGSGAFLFAALEVLEDIYSHGLDVATDLSEKSDFSKDLVTIASNHANRRYFIRKQIALNNLYGTDIMSDAIETAKLRIFLALASCLDASSDIEPLPDLDFNLKVGNLVVGFKDESDGDERSSDQIFGALEAASLAPKISSYKSTYGKFVRALQEDSNDYADLRADLFQQSQVLRDDANAIYAQHFNIRQEDWASWVLNKKPFHWFAEFPQIITEGGFDVIIGNPPYMKMSEIDRADVAKYETRVCPDFYAVCYERSLQLLHPRGRHAFIVMLNLSFSDGFASLRNVISRRKSGEWWSTYGKRPDSLFAGVQVRNTILITAPEGEVLTSAHQIFSKYSRPSMFSNLTYGNVSRPNGEIISRAGIAFRLANTIGAQEISNSKIRSDKKLVIRPTAQYWFPVLPGSVPLLNSQGQTISDADSRLKTDKPFDGELRELSVAVLAGKLGYLWWSATGDDFDAMISQTEKLRCWGTQFKNNSELLKLALDVIESGKSAIFLNSNAGKMQLNIRWTAVRAITDEFDKKLLEVAGLSNEWRNLNIWYRQVMKSTGENQNSRYLTPEEVAKLDLDW